MPSQSEFEERLLAALGASGMRSPLELGRTAAPEPGELLLLLEGIETRLAILETQIFGKPVLE